MYALDFRCVLWIPYFFVRTYILFSHQEKNSILHTRQSNDSWKIFTKKFKFNNYTTPYHAFQHPATLNSGCAVSLGGKLLECTLAKLCSLGLQPKAGFLGFYIKVISVDIDLGYKTNLF